MLLLDNVTTEMAERFGVVVVGAGPGGLGTAAMLGRRGIRTVVLERGDGVGAKWRHSYDSLRINTSAWFSYLPGQRLRLDKGQWPSRDDLVRYYETYAAANALDVRLNTEATRVEPRGGGWTVFAGSASYEAAAVVIAAAKDRTPVIPDWPGRSEFGGSIVHAAAYCNSEPYRERTVLVVGAGNSGFDIALDLLRGGASTVWLSIRTPPHIVRRSVGPVPNDVMAVLSSRLPAAVVDPIARVIRRASFGDLAPYGLPEPPDGLKSHLRNTGMIPTIDPGAFTAAVRSGALPIVAAVERFDQDSVTLADGAMLSPDAVIAATGYSPDLDALVGHLNVLREDGFPCVAAPDSPPGAPGLYFIGYTRPLAGNLRQLRLDARRTAAAVARSARVSTR